MNIQGFKRHFWKEVERKKWIIQKTQLSFPEFKDTSLNFEERFANITEKVKFFNSCDVSLKEAEKLTGFTINSVKVFHEGVEYQNISEYQPEDPNYDSLSCLQNILTPQFETYIDEVTGEYKIGDMIKTKIVLNNRLRLLFNDNDTEN